MVKILSVMIYQLIDKEKFQIFHFIGGGGGRIINTVSAAGLTVSITTQ